ncbi:wee protein kinase [Plasmopara halstedii]|uniref:Wee protein kinase n=1 Tax=Plasmopara halstedii TaxID=4781 RepID=A0A0P1A3V4_PLAHL|nr:wee protein kinase [Plasmopara halstedii]CEG35130.1 wee protein kinase [Plasmopara halstedii]|eukprot:XP_024571499.1 wee protein kinase [Plasmopara halstedii]
MATRARSLHAAMEEASSSGVKKRLSFTISDDDGANDEKKIRENFCQRNDICNDISSQGMNSVKAIDTRGNHRYRTRRMERTDVYSRKDTLYRRHDLPSADKVKQHRRSSSEQSTPTSHRRAELARQCVVAKLKLNIIRPVSI